MFKGLYPRGFDAHDGWSFITRKAVHGWVKLILNTAFVEK